MVPLSLTAPSLVEVIAFLGLHKHWGRPKAEVQRAIMAGMVHGVQLPSVPHLPR